MKKEGTAPFLVMQALQGRLERERNTHTERDRDRDRYERERELYPLTAVSFFPGGVALAAACLAEVIQLVPRQRSGALPLAEHV